MREINIKPKKGLLVRDPDTRKPLAAAGELKPRDTYWLRRISEGSALIVEPKKEAKS